MDGSNILDQLPLVEKLDREYYLLLERLVALPQSEVAMTSEQLSEYQAILMRMNHIEVMLIELGCLPTALEELVARFKPGQGEQQHLTDLDIERAHRPFTGDIPRVGEWPTSDRSRSTRRQRYTARPT